MVAGVQIGFNLNSDDSYMNYCALAHGCHQFRLDKLVNNLKNQDTSMQVDAMVVVGDWDRERSDHIDLDERYRYAVCASSRNGHSPQKLLHREQSEEGTEFQWNGKD